MTFTLLAIISLLTNTARAEPPLRFLRTELGGVRLSLNTYTRVVMPDFHPPVNTDSDSYSSGFVETAQKSITSASTILTNNAVSHLQGDIVAEGDGDTTISAPAIVLGTHNISFDGSDPSDANLSASVGLDWDVEFVADNESESREDSGFYTVSVSVSYEAQALTSGIAHFNHGATGYIQVTVGEQIVTVYALDGVWVSDSNGVVTVIEPSSGIFSVSASSELFIEHDDVVDISGALWYNLTSLTVDGGSVLGVSDMVVQVRVE
ncbi:hypothetical protein [Planctopirus hydrillae]|uniref:Uncharacterized protein n=1 Tax=Planctopirus hydrillae TaxID=1841610 RepID=A0A1C3EU66_9PLAN|nr:hypothetical protein [Planctopirus hydrillae]ODA36684.1 hypothetical protein A6X21_15735 [Planctopirus hydrillae]